MAISRVGSPFSNAAATASANPTFVLPAGITAGDFELFVLTMSSTSTTPTLAGWTISSAFDNGANERSFFIWRTSPGGDSGATITLTLASTRWAIAGAVYTGVASIDVTTTTQDTSLQGTFTVPSFPPASSFEWAVLLSGGQRAFGTTDGVSAYPSGFVNGVSAATNNSGASDVEAVFAEKSLGATVATQSATTGTWNGSSRANTWIITLVPTAAATSGSDSASGGLIQTLAVTANLSPADTAAGVDTATANAALSDTDTAAGADAASVAAGVAPADVGAGADSLTADATASPADTAAAADTATTTAAVAPADAGGAVESVTISATTGGAADTGSGTDSLLLGVRGTDTASGGLIQSLSVEASNNPADTAAGVDALTVVAHISALDTGAAVDSASAGTAPDTPQLSDAATGTDGLTVVKSDLIQIFRSELGHDADTVNPPLYHGEPIWDGGAIRVGPIGGGNTTDQPRTLMAGAGTVRTITATGPIVKADWVIVCNGSSITVTLPDPTTVPGWRYIVKNIHSTSLTLATAGGVNIDGSATQSLAQWAALEVVSNGTQWLIV